jgi:hypothetical protein
VIFFVGIRSRLLVFNPLLNGSTPFLFNLLELPETFPYCKGVKKTHGKPKKELKCSIKNLLTQLEKKGVD